MLHYHGNIRIVCNVVAHNSSYIQIADDDLSDDIPGLVGDWCLLTDGRYIPRSCLKNFKYETMFKGAPAEFIDTPFEFAGGSGTRRLTFNFLKSYAKCLLVPITTIAYTVFAAWTLEASGGWNVVNVIVILIACTSTQKKILSELFA